MKKKCELCKSPANLFCESDQASLCWECDTRVHTANFIVTKHQRFLLCHICQSLTAWHGTGPKFVPTMSLCNYCVSVTNGHQNHDSDDDDDDDDDEDEDSDDDDEENQVVPWKSTPRPVSSCSSNSATTY